MHEQQLILISLMYTVSEIIIFVQVINVKVKNAHRIMNNNIDRSLD